MRSTIDIYNAGAEDPVITHDDALDVVPPSPGQYERHSPSTVDLRDEHVATEVLGRVLGRVGHEHVCRRT
eukprot:scaffold34378_cov129-Isochrysis_galbana.AAC.4